MKGKEVFSSSEKQKILALITELRSGIDRKQQRKTRNELRSLGFYITDFDNSFKGFTCLDFFELIENNKIVIID